MHGAEANIMLACKVLGKLTLANVPSGRVLFTLENTPLDNVVPVFRRVNSKPLFVC